MTILDARLYDLRIKLDQAILLLLVGAAVGFGLGIACVYRRDTATDHEPCQEAP